MRFHISGLFLAAAVGFAFAQGGSAIITLGLPPPAGEAYSALRAGAALPEGAASLFFNPALLAELNRSTGSQAFFSQSNRRLIPGFPDIYQKFWSAAAVVPDPDGGTDMAVGFFRNRLSFGDYILTDGQGNETGRFASWESVYGLGTAIRLGMPVSLGVTAKYFESHLADGYQGARPARSFAFDLGLVFHPRLAPAATLGWPAIILSPSLAVVTKNLGPDVEYGEALVSDPIPTTYTAAYGFKLEALDMVEAEAGADMDQEWTRRTETWDQQRILGYSWRLLVFRHGTSWYDYPAGRVSERRASYSLELDCLRLHRIWRRLRSLDYRTRSEDLDGSYAFPLVKWLGIPLRANPHAEAGIRRIETGPLRGKGGPRWYFSLSL